ncbi:hypothetical protein V1512DRAFT_260343 [Lipomyces arxii]|uniref:uncharacterized protein n=1 Tax=Lipomyces arxii TaxID=56418 RepID=UPI0034CE12A2
MSLDRSGIDPVLDSDKWLDNLSKELQHTSKLETPADRHRRVHDENRTRHHRNRLLERPSQHKSSRNHHHSDSKERHRIREESEHELKHRVEEKSRRDDDKHRSSTRNTHRHHTQVAKRARNASPDSKRETSKPSVNDSSSDEGEWIEASTISVTDAEPNGTARPRQGPTLPSVADIQMLNSEILDRSISDIDLARKQQADTREAMYNGVIDNLLPDNRRDAGVRDRKDENRRLQNESRKEYNRARSPGGIEEMGDHDLFGGDDGTSARAKMSEIASRRAEKDRIRKEQREAKYRERDAERRSRWEDRQAKEKKTIEMFKELARQRFGGSE